jgi:regulator of cell morphogenesis and NO signaling
VVEGLATKVARVHGGGDARLHELDAAVQGLVDSLKLHIAEEERDVFPLLRGGATGDQVREPLRAMHFEHAGIVAMFERMRFLTDDFTRPPNACNSYRRLFDGLEALEREVREHVALEDELAARFTGSAS